MKYLAGFGIANNFSTNKLGRDYCCYISSSSMAVDYYSSSKFLQHTLHRRNSN